jgi:hypothetical protein
MLLHLIKLLLEILTIGYAIVITRYSINNVIRRSRYKGVGGTSEVELMALAELINKEKKYDRRISAALRGSHKNTPVEISSNVVEQQFNPGDAKWKRKQKQFPVLKTGNCFIGYPKFAITKSFTKNPIIDFVLLFRDEIRQITFFQNYKAIIQSSKIIFACLEQFFTLCFRYYFLFSTRQ